MRDWIKRWLGTPKPFSQEGLFNELQQAQRAHLSDLRVLIDKGHEREAMLASMLQESASRAKGQPAAERRDNPVAPTVPLEHLSDVSTFSEEEDAADVARENSRFDKLQTEFNELFEEQATEGIHKP